MLTTKQHQLLLFISDKLTATGVSPSFDEMKDALGLKSKSGVHRLINALEERGFIRRMANRARALEILKMPEISQETNDSKVVTADFSKKTKAQTSTASETLEIPLHGQIAAGTPITALENPDSFVSVPTGMIGRGDCYALEVSGDSMIEMGIMDGDTIIIESSETARDGEVVVALVDSEEATLKTLKRQGKDVALIPANREYETQIYSADRVKVQGRLISLMRQYH